MGSRQWAVGNSQLRSLSEIIHCLLPTAYCLLRSRQSERESMELWLVDLEAAAPALEALEREVPRLSADDRDRAGRLADAHERRNRLAAYTALRVLLERVGGAGGGGQRPPPPPPRTPPPPAA